MDDSIRSRRALIVGAGSMVAAAALGARGASAQSAGAFRPAAHAEDGWLDQRPGKHRIFIDSATPNGAGAVVLAIWCAAKVFQIGLLMYGKPPDLKTLGRWIRQS